MALRKKNMFYPIISVLLSVLALIFPALKANASETVQVISGMNYVDIDGDGTRDLVIKAWRENFNAHGFSIYSFYVKAMSPQGDEPVLQIIPFEVIGKTSFRNYFRTYEGAECKLRDLKLIVNKTGGVDLVTADRDFGDNFADKRHVTFSTYKITRNYKGLPGVPLLYFSLSGKRISQGEYCDVIDAFRDEPGINTK